MRVVAVGGAPRADLLMSLMSTLDMKRVYKNADKSTSAFRSRTAAHGHEADVTSRWTVGPGAYEISSFFSPEKLPTNGNQSAFRSRRRAFMTGPPKTPGPGAYAAKNLSAGWGSRSRQQHVSGPVLGPSSSSSSNAFVWTRRATAPSIPSIDTAMGYEEDAYGQLVPQEAPRPPAGAGRRRSVDPPARPRAIRAARYRSSTSSTTYGPTGARVLTSRIEDGDTGNIFQFRSR